MKSKILFVLHYSPPIHGASKVGDSIKKSVLLKQLFKTTFIKIKSSNSIDKIGEFSFLKALLFIQLWTRVIYKIVSFRPEIIYYTVSPKGFAFYRDFSIMLFIKLYRILSGCKVIFHYHSRGIRSFTESSKLSLTLTNFFVKDVYIVFISPLLNREIDLIKGYKKVFYLKNGVNDNLKNEEFEAIAKNRVQNNTFNVLYLSNMMKSKGYDKVLLIAKQFKDRGLLNIKFNFAGSWASKSDESFFKSFVSDNDLHAIVKYHGLVKGEDKKSLFLKSNVFIFPSIYNKEIFPLSLLEALSYGLPIISYDVGATSEIVTNEVGSLTDETNIFSVLKSYVDNRNDTDRMYICRSEFKEKYAINVFENNLKIIFEAVQA